MFEDDTACDIHGHYKGCLKKGAHGPGHRGEFLTNIRIWWTILMNLSIPFRFSYTLRLWCVGFLGACANDDPLYSESGGSSQRESGCRHDPAILNARNVCAVRSKRTRQHGLRATANQPESPKALSD
jgi:hypothetical protein